MPPASRIRQGVALAAVLAALTPVSAALAQGAGDNQYSDPFGDDPTPTATAKPHPTATPRPAPTATPAPAQSAATPVPAAAQAAATPAPEHSSAGGRDKLPYTGFDGWPMALGGAVLLGAGVTLRLRLRELD
jgi:hypothetical protein